MFGFRFSAFAARAVVWPSARALLLADALFLRSVLCETMFVPCITLISRHRDQGGRRTHGDTSTSA